MVADPVHAKSHVRIPRLPTLSAVNVHLGRCKNAMASSQFDYVHNMRRVDPHRQGSYKSIVQERHAFEDLHKNARIISSFFKQNHEERQATHELSKVARRHHLY
jgi:hypothetical protein